MKIDEQQHPDYLADKRAFDSITHGGRQALEDAALAAYFAVLDSGGAVQAAQDAFFNVFNNEDK